MYENANPHMNMQSVSRSDIDARIGFIRKTYAHVFGAILALMAVCAGLLFSGGAAVIASLAWSTSFSWMILLGIFMFTTHIAQKWATSETSVGIQYAGMALMVGSYSIIFSPLLLVAASTAPATIPAAGFITLTVFAGLTVYVFMTKKDFSFLGAAIAIGSFLALGIIVFAWLFDLTLGVWFAAGMVLLMAGSILYQTSNIMHRYHPSQYVAASLALFSAVAMMFYYVLYFLISLRD